MDQCQIALLTQRHSVRMGNQNPLDGGESLSVIRLKRTLALSAYQVIFLTSFRIVFCKYNFYVLDNVISKNLYRIFTTYTDIVLNSCFILFFNYTLGTVTTFRMFSQCETCMHSLARTKIIHVNFFR